MTEPEVDKPLKETHDPVVKSLKVGDTVRLGPRCVGYKSVGVIVGEEVWMDRNKPILWNQVGEYPEAAIKWRLSLPRFLVKVLEFRKHPSYNGIAHASWVQSCQKEPHNYPYCTEREIDEVIERPEVKHLGGNEWLARYGSRPDHSVNSDCPERACWALAKALALTPSVYVETQV